MLKVSDKFPGDYCALAGDGKPAKILIKLKLCQVICSSVLADNVWALQWDHEACLSQGLSLSSRPTRFLQQCFEAYSSTWWIVSTSNLDGFSHVEKNSFIISDESPAICQLISYLTFRKPVFTKNVSHQVIVTAQGGLRWFFFICMKFYDMIHFSLPHCVIQCKVVTRSGLTPSISNHLHG